MNNPTKREQKCIDCMIINFGGKWLNCAIYEKCLRKFQMSTSRFEDFVRVEFNNGYVKIIRRENVGTSPVLKWYFGNTQITL